MKQYMCVETGVKISEKSDDNYCKKLRPLKKPGCGGLREVVEQETWGGGCIGG